MIFTKSSSTSLRTEPGNPTLVTVSAAPFLARVVHGTTPTSTGVQSYTVAGMGDPAGALIIGGRASTLGSAGVSNGWSETWGITDGTNQNVCYSSARDNVATAVATAAGHNNSLFRLVDPATGTIIVEGVFSAWTTNGISINWTTVDSTAWQFSILLLGGSQCQVFVTNAAPPGTPFTGATTVTPTFATDFCLTRPMRSTNGSAGVQADFGIGISIKNAGSPLNYSGQYMAANGSPTNVRCSTSILGLGNVMTLNPGSTGDTITSMTAINNYTSTTVDVVNATTTSQGVRLAIMCVKVNGATSVGVAMTDGTTPTATGNQAATWPGTKTGALYAVFTNSTVTSDAPGSGLGVGFSDLRANSACVQVTGKTNVNPSKTRSVVTHALFDQYNADAAEQYTVSIVSQDATGYTLNFTVAPVSGRKYYALAIQEMPIVVLPTGIASAQAMGSPTIVRGTLSVAPTGIASGQAMGTPTIVRGALLVHPTGIASAQAMGTPTIVRGALSVSPTGIASTQAFGVPTIVRGTLLVHPTGIGSSEAFGTPLIVEPITVAPVGIPSAQAFGMPTIILGTDTVVPVGITSTEAFGVPTIVRGTLLVHPNGIGSTEAFGTPTIVHGALIVHPTGIASSEVFGNPVINNGGVVVQIASIPSAEAFGSPTIVRGAINVHIVGVASAEAFGSPTIFIVAPISVQPIGIASAEAFGSPIITNVPPVIAMMLNKKRAYDAILSRVAGAVFVRISYDQASSTLTVGDEVKPKSVLLNELSTTFVEAKRWRRSYKQQRDRWTWNLILMFDKEASTEIFERDMLDNPIHLPADRPNGLEAFTVKAIDANYVIPPQQQSSNGTRASYRVTVEFAPV